MTNYDAKGTLVKFPFVALKKRSDYATVQSWVEYAKNLFRGLPAGSHPSVAFFTYQCICSRGTRSCLDTYIFLERTGSDIGSMRVASTVWLTKSNCSCV